MYVSREMQTLLPSRRSVTPSIKSRSHLSVRNFLLGFRAGNARVLAEKHFSHVGITQRHRRGSGIVLRRVAAREKGDDGGGKE